MAEEFQAGICGENWWNPPKSVFAGGLLPCYMVNTSDMGTNYGTSWMTNDLLDPKPRSCKEANISADSAIGFQNSLKAQQADSDGAGGSILMDSTLQMMGFGLSSSSSSSSDWSQTLLPGGGRGADSYNSMLQEDMNQGLNSSQIPKEWSPKSFASTAEDSSINSTLTALKDQEISLDQQRIVPVISSGSSAQTCQGLYTSFSMESPQSYGYSSALIQSLFEPDPQPQQQPFFSDRSMNYLSPPNHAANLNELSPSWSKITSLMKPSLTKQQPSTLQFSNNTAFWKSSATAISNIRATDITSSQSQYLVPSLEEKPNCGNLTSKSTSTDEDRDSGSGVKKGSEPSFKRPRIETPSPLPTFKVRKEKLGDRITALQQLVSPFGKTDTASVLHEAIDYIKFLHDQVSVLSAPYMKNGNPVQRQQGADRLKESEGKQDLKSRGLCLVPISSTFPVANETTVDFWTPTFGGTFR